MRMPRRIQFRRQRKLRFQRSVRERNLFGRKSLRRGRLRMPVRQTELGRFAMPRLHAGQPLRFNAKMRQIFVYLRCGNVCEHDLLHGSKPCLRQNGRMLHIRFGMHGNQPEMRSFIAYLHWQILLRNQFVVQNFLRFARSSDGYGCYGKRVEMLHMRHLRTMVHAQKRFVPAVKLSAEHGNGQNLFRRSKSGKHDGVFRFQRLPVLHQLRRGRKVQLPGQSGRQRQRRMRECRSV